jgi:hypothetical protein
MTGATIGAGTAYSSGASQFTSDLSWVFIAQSYVFCALLHRLLFVLLSFFCWPLYCLSIDVWPLIKQLVSTNSSYLTLELKIYLIGIQNNKCYIDRWATQEL